MNREDIIRMAREAGLIRDDSTASRWLPGTDLYPELNVFAALVAAAEREACAKVCDMAHARHIAEYGDYIGETYAAECAAAIRARGNT